MLQLTRRKPAAPWLAQKAFATMALLLLHCGSAPDTAQPPQAPATRAPILRFTQARLFIGHLDTKVALPVSPDSVLPGQALVSDAPEIASANADGTVTAHRNGRARLRGAAEGASIEVVVAATKTLWISPGEARLGPGESQSLHVLGDDGLAIDSEAIAWSSTTPSIAMVDAGRIVAGTREGRAQIVASYGGAQASAIVVVGPKAPPPPLFRQAPKRLHVGEIGQFELAMGETAKWTSSNKRVLGVLQAGLFRARTRGRAEACASDSAEQRTCASVEVIQ